MKLQADYSVHVHVLESLVSLILYLLNVKEVKVNDATSNFTWQWTPISSIADPLPP